MSRRRLGAVAFFVIMAGMIGPAALADGSSPFSVTTSISTGLRTETSTAPTFTSTTVNSGGTFSTTDTGNVAPSATVVETLVAGDNWTVTAQVCAPLNAANPVAVNGQDCSKHELDAITAPTGGTFTGDKILGSSQIVATPGSVSHTAVATVPDGTVVAGSASQTMGSSITVMSATESSSTAYSDLGFTNSTRLDVSNVFTAGTYYGYWVTTLNL